MRRVLVDTGALVALARESDAYHARAVHFFGECRTGELLTTDSDFEIYRTRALRSLEPVDW